MSLSRPAEPDAKAAHRHSTSHSEDQYARIADIASGNHVSFAFVVREAVERMLTESQPRLPQRRRRA